MNVTSRTPLYKIIETVKAQFGVNIDYAIAREIRGAAVDHTLCWSDKSLIIAYNPADFETHNLWMITLNEIDYAGGLFRHDEWNALTPPVTLRRRPSFYVVKISKRGAPSKIAGGPYPSPQTVDGALFDFCAQDNTFDWRWKSITRTEAIKRGLLKDV